MNVLMTNNCRDDSICRVCLSSQKENHMSLFDKYRSCLIFEYINILSNVNIVENDGFPNKICRSCFLELETALSFVEKCEHSNKLLQSQNLKVESTDSKVVVKNKFDADITVEESDVLNLKKEIVYNDSESFSHDYEQPLNQDGNITHSVIDNNKTNNSKLVVKIIFDADITVEESNGFNLKKEIIHDDSESFSHDYEQPLDQDDNLTHSVIDNNKTDDSKLVVTNEFDADITVEESDGLNLKKESIYNDSESFSHDYEQLLDQDDNLTHSESDNNKSKKRSDSTVECHDCSDIFISKCKLQVHWKKTHMYSQLICIRCKSTFKSYKTLHKHMKRKPRRCNVAASERVHIEGEGPSRLYYCKACNYQTVKLHAMVFHLRIHSGEPPYECDICFSKFTHHNALQTHKEVTHKKITDEIACQFCGKLLRGRHNINRHLKNHVEKIQCKICKKLIHKYYHKVHMKTVHKVS